MFVLLFAPPVYGPGFNAVESTSVCPAPSAGRPKGVLMSHRGLLAYAWQKAALHKVTRGSRVLLASASTFDPSLGDIFSTLGAPSTLWTRVVGIDACHCASVIEH